MSPSNRMLVTRRAAGLVAARLEVSEISYANQDLGRFTLFSLLGHQMGPALPLASVSPSTDPRGAGQLA
ncbi:hypothetical protein DFAR_1000004 [Desulfarculales bacterium]